MKPPLPRTLATSGTDDSAPAPPERSPLEPLGSYGRRVKKWQSDNARWKGQKRALEMLGEKTTRVPETPDPKAFP